MLYRAQPLLNGAQRDSTSTLPGSSSALQDLTQIEEEEANIRLLREMHQEVLRLHLEEDRLRNRRAELLMARRDR